MAWEIISTVDTVQRTLASGDGLWISRSGVLLTINGAVGSGSSNVSVRVEGALHGSRAIGLGGDFEIDSLHSVLIAESGVVSATAEAIQIFGFNSSVTNHGSISTGATGVQMFASAFGTTSYVLNTGSINAFNGVRHSGSEDFKLINTGLIFGSNTSFLETSVGAGKTTIINSGEMFGDITLGSNNDTYDGRLGTIVGTITGNEGADTFLVGLGAEVIDGGIGTDTLDFRSTGGIQVALDGSIGNTGTAAGDTYTGIERIFGSAGNDVLIGDTAANSLYGFGGSDKIDGEEGADFISGGRGVDTLSGGLANDRFVFSDLKDAGDLITDFTNSATNNDVFNIRASGFGGGLVAGALLASQFQSRADNVAQDSNDRFVFRTTDKTLWFDADGSGGGAALMLADLQASATLTFADIILT